jgi:hypothetical protein
VIGIEGDGEAADIKGDVTESFSFVSLMGLQQSPERRMPRQIGLPVPPVASVLHGIA